MRPRFYWVGEIEFGSCDKSGREFPQQAISSSQAVAATPTLLSELTPITPDPSTRKRIAEKVSTTTKKNEAEEEMVSSLKNGKGCCTIM